MNVKNIRKRKMKNFLDKFWYTIILIILILIFTLIDYQLTYGIKGI